MDRPTAGRVVATATAFSLSVVCGAGPRNAALADRGSVLQNGSFEVGLQDWVGYARSCRVGGGFDYPEDIRVVSLDLQPRQARSADAPDGEHALLFEIPRKADFGVESRWYEVKPGRYLVRAFYKSDEPLTFGCGGVSRKVGPSKTWRKLEFPVTVTKRDPRLRMGFGGQGKGTYWVDAVTVIPLDDPPVAWRVDLGLAVPPADKVLLGARDTRLTVRAFSRSATSGTVRYRVENGFDREVLRGTLTVDLPGGRVMETTANLKLKETGHYRVLAEFNGPPGTSSHVSELLFAVVPDRVLPGATSGGRDSHFGCSMRLRPHLIQVARKIGIRWVMCAPPLFTKWFSTEPAKGEWLFWDEHVRMLRNAGIHILGNLADPPWWATHPGSKTRSGPWPNPRRPTDWRTWENYVRTVVRHYYPHIRDWAVWNEPNHPTYLHVDKNKKENWVDKYIEILKHTYGAARSVADDVRIVGGTVTHVEALTDLIQGGALKYMDVGAFHWAAWTRKGYVRNTGEERGLPGRLDACRKAMARAGKSVPLWDTEAHMTQAEIEHEFVTQPQPPRRQATPRMTRLDAANAVVRQTVVEWAGGVDKTFYWRLDPTGTVRADSTMLEWDRSPAASLVAYAVMTKMLEGAQFVRWDDKSVRRGIERVKFWIFEFRKGRDRLRLVWGNTDTSHELLLPVRGKATVTDLFGAACPGSASMSAMPLKGKVVLRVGRSPFYIVDEAEAR